MQYNHGIQLEREEALFYNTSSKLVRSQLMLTGNKKDMLSRTTVRLNGVWTC